MDEDEITLFPEGTMIFEPDQDCGVYVQFPRSDDAIVYYEILRQIHIGNVELNIVRES